MTAVGGLRKSSLLNLMENVMKTCRVIEIRAGEGGADARQFVTELATAYLKLATRKG